MSASWGEATATEIQEELNLCEVMLDTLPRTEDGYEDQKVELQQTIYDLKKRLLQAQASSSTTNSGQDSHPSFVETGSRRIPSGRAIDSSSGRMEPFLSADEDRLGGSSMSGSMSKHKDRDAEASLEGKGRGSPDAFSLGHSPPMDEARSLAVQRSKKRPREGTSSYTALEGPDTKSRRTTPSPQVFTGPTTPSSFSSFGIPSEDLDFFREVAGASDVADLRELRKRQRESERMAHSKLSQELWDAAFAQTLQDEERRLVPPPEVLSSNDESGPPSASLEWDTREISHPRQAASSNITFPPLRHRRSTPADIKRQDSRSVTDGTKVIGALEEENLNHMPGAFQDSDDDLQIIDKGDFQPNRRAPSSNAATGQPQTPWRLGEAAFQGLPRSEPLHDAALQLAQDNYHRDLNQTMANTDGQHSAPHLESNAESRGTAWSAPSSFLGARTGRALPDLAAPYHPRPEPSTAMDPAYRADDDDLRQAVGWDPEGILWERRRRRARYHDPYAFDPAKSHEELKSLIENIRPDTELPPENREGTPEAMEYPLMEHQKLGLTWMKNMEIGSNKGGILADAMGLGKTIQALALLVSRPSGDPQRKTTLIVAPVALLKQWEREIQTKLKAKHRLKTFLLHASKRKADWKTLRTYDVVLTTFGTLASEFNRRQAALMARTEGEGASSGGGPNLPLLGDASEWYRVIIDEAQCIKNRSTKAAMGARALKALTRFCLTGTPMMNGVGELHSLIEFLRIKPYNEAYKFKQDFTRIFKSNHADLHDSAMRKFQALLKAILLRRTKDSKIDGNPIIDIPPRTNEIQHAVFDEDQDAFYKALETRTQLQFNKYMRQGTVGKNYSNVLVLLLRLRQACCHPHLIQDFAQEIVTTTVSADELSELAQRLAPEVVARIRELQAFECPVCYDAVENPAIFIPCGHDTCAECFAKISDQSNLQGLAQGNESAETKCPSCRGKVSTKQIIDYNTFKRVHMAADVPEKAEADVEDEDDDSETESETDGDDDDSDDSSDSFRGFVVDSDEDEEYNEGKTPFEKAKKSKRPAANAKSKKDIKGKGKATESSPAKTLAQLKKEGMRNVKARRTYMRRLGREWIPSAKIDKCCEILEGIQAAGEGEKTIVFSQFTSLLDLLEIPISRKGWSFKRYDGSMTSTQRNDAVVEFTDKPDCKIMLVSLKAGNAGLNLVAANQVIMLDPFWNPFIEEQAVDRTHRIGQLRPVTVHRILVQNTVEDRIVALQEKKRELIEGALDEKASQSIGRLGERELAFLFVGRPY